MRLCRFLLFLILCLPIQAQVQYRVISPGSGVASTEFADLTTNRRHNTHLIMRPGIYEETLLSAPNDGWGPCALVGLTNVTIEGYGAIISNGVAAAATHIAVSNCYNVRFLGLTIQGKNMPDPVTSTFSHGGIKMWGTNWFEIAHCRFLNCPEQALHGGSTQHSTNAWIHHNYAYQCGYTNSAGWADGGFALFGEGTLFEFNVAEDCARGIEAEGAAFAGAHRGIRIVNNTVRYSRGDASIVIFGTVDGDTDIECVGNHVIVDPARINSGKSHAGIWVSGVLSRARITGNTIVCTGNSAVPPTSGIDATGGGDYGLVDCVIADNRMTNTYVGLGFGRFAAGTARSEGNLVKGNIIDRTAHYGMQVFGGNNIIEDNIIRNPGVGFANISAIALRKVAGGEETTNNIVRGNWLGDVQSTALMSYCLDVEANVINNFIYDNFFFRPATGVFRTTSVNNYISGARRARNITKTSNYTVALEDVGCVLDNSGAGGQFSFTLPTPWSGLGNGEPVFKFVVRTAQGVVVRAPASTTIRIAGTVTAAAGCFSNAVAGSTLVLHAVSGTEYIAESSQGTWTAHN